MLRRKHDITDCIESSLAGSYIDYHDHEVASLDRTLKELLAEKKGLANELQARKSEFEKRTKYLKSISNTAAIARQEVPRMRIELSTLREKLSRMSQEAGHWDKITEREEQKVALQEEKRVRLQADAQELRNRLDTLTANASRIADELHHLELALEKYDDARESYKIIADPAAAAGSLPSSLNDATLLISEMENLIAALKSGRREILDLEARKTPINSDIQEQKKQISATESRSTEVKAELARRQADLEKATAENEQRRQELATLRERYEKYAQLAAEEDSVKKQYDSMAGKVMESCNVLKQALVENSKLELKLRFEDLKIKLLERELESISG